MAARCNCLRRWTSSIVTMRAVKGSDAASAKRIASTSSRYSIGAFSASLLNALLDNFLADGFGEVLGKRGFADEVHEMLLGNNGHDRLRIIHQPTQDRQSREKVGLTWPIQRQCCRPGYTLL